MKAYKLADFTAKTGRFCPGLDMKNPGPIRRYIMRQNYNCMVRLTLVVEVRLVGYVYWVIKVR
jgi:hypothetical protein